jgi:hypothetical protein
LSQAEIVHLRGVVRQVFIMSLTVARSERVRGVLTHASWT